MGVKIILELKKKPAKGELLIFDGEFFTPITKDTLLKEVNDNARTIKSILLNNDVIYNNKFEKLNNEIELLKNEIKILKGEDEDE